jgi:hypothetical protein
MTEKKQLIGQVAPEQIEAWKKLYGDIYSIEVKGHICYVKGFTRETAKYALSQLKIKIDTSNNSAEMDMEKLLAIGEIGLQNGFIGGSEAFKTNDNLWISAALQMGELFEIAEAKIKKL